MSDIPVTRNDDPQRSAQRALAEIVAREGRAALLDARRTRSMLADLAPFASREVGLLEQAISAGVAARLLGAAPAHELVAELRSAGMTADAASWVIAAIAAALGTEIDVAPGPSSPARPLPPPTPRPGFAAPARTPAANTRPATIFGPSPVTVAADRAGALPIVAPTVLGDIGAPTPPLARPPLVAGTEPIVVPLGGATNGVPGGHRRRTLLLAIGAVAVVAAGVVGVIAARSSDDEDGAAITTTIAVAPPDTDVLATDDVEIVSPETAAETTPETAPPETAPPETAVPETSPPETAPLETAAPAPPPTPDELRARLIEVYPAIAGSNDCNYAEPSWLCGFQVDSGYVVVLFGPNDTPNYLDYFVTEFGGVRSLWVDTTGAVGGEVVLYMRDGNSELIWSFADTASRAWTANVYWPNGDQAAMVAWWTSVSSDRPA